MSLARVLTHERNALRGLLLKAKKREAVPSHALGRPRLVTPLRSHALLTPGGYRGPITASKRPIVRTRWKGQKIWRKDGKFVHRNCEQCRSEFWAKMPWARFCSTTCRVLSAYHKKRIRRCIQPAGQGQRPRPASGLFRRQAKRESYQMASAFVLRWPRQDSCWSKDVSA